MTLGQFDALPDLERDAWVADWQLSRLECSDCGLPIEECSDPARKFYPYRRVCYATMERQAASEAYHALHEERPYHDGTFQSWAAKRSASHPYHFEAAVTIGVATTDLAPWDHFTTKRNASPVAPKQSPGEKDEPGDAAEEDDGPGHLTDH